MNRTLPLLLLAFLVGCSGTASSPLFGAAIRADDAGGTNDSGSVDGDVADDAFVPIVVTPPVPVDASVPPSTDAGLEEDAVVGLDVAVADPDAATPPDAGNGFDATDAETADTALPPPADASMPDTSPSDLVICCTLWPSSGTGTYCGCPGPFSLQVSATCNGQTTQCSAQVGVCKMGDPCQVLFPNGSSAYGSISN